MNERIRLFEKQCWNYQANCLDAEKFAQLIVAECAQAILETPVDYEEIDTMHRIRDRVKQHFEVEE